MRPSVGLLLLCAACGSSGAGRADESGEPDPQTRVVYRQYYRGSSIFIVENIAGRDLKDLRSRPLQEGETPVAYVPDDVMREMLKEFRRFGFDDHAGPRPRNPIKVGGIGEMTVIDEDRNMVAIIRQRRQDVKVAECYGECVKTFLAVWNHFRPFGQAVTGDTKFGVQRAERGR